MKFIPNEKAYVEKMIVNEKVNNPKKEKKDLILIIRYFLEVFKDEKDALWNTMGIISKMYGEEDYDKWWEFVNNFVKQYDKKKQRPLTNVTQVGITKKELEIIDSIKNEKLEKVAFGLLVYCKIWNAIKNKKDCWVNMSETAEFYRDIMISANTTTRETNFFKLQQLGLITIPRKTGSEDIKLDFIDLDGDSEIVIDSLDDFILDYYIYKGKKVINCKECGSRILVKGNASTKYCSVCKKEKTLENTRKRVKNHRKNQ